MAENNQGQQNQAAQEQDIHQLLKVRREKLANLQEAGKDPFQITKYDVTHHSREIKDNFETLEGKTVSIAGRIMQKRVQTCYGKGFFLQRTGFAGQYPDLRGKGQYRRGVLCGLQKI